VDVAEALLVELAFLLEPLFYLAELRELRFDAWRVVRRCVRPFGLVGVVVNGLVGGSIRLGGFRLGRCLRLYGFCCTHSRFASCRC
jgi:hypothetical protein